MEDKILTEIKEYFANTPKEQIEKDFKDLEEFNLIGEKVTDFIARHEAEEKRHECNINILKTLDSFIYDSPYAKYLRFGQILYALNILKQNEDIFNVESEVIFNRMKIPNENND